MAKNQKGELVIKISFPYDLDMIFKVRTLPGRNWHKEARCWSCPVTISSINYLIEWGFELDDHLKAFVEKIKVKEDTIVVSGVKGLKGELYPFQYKGVAFIETNRGRALIADEMGLGKTIQALAWLQMHRDKSPVVIIVPASLKLNWKREAEKWLPFPGVEILSGTQPWKLTGDMIIINYDIVHAWIDDLKRIKPQVLIMDEVHYIKSNKAHRTKAVKQLGKGIPHIIGLSGTPIINRPVEAFNAIQLINPDLFPNYWEFTHKYCNAHHNGFGWNFSGASNTDELHKRLIETIMIRRLKKDVLPDLPDKIYSFIPIELENEKEYLNAENDFVKYIKDTKGKDAAKRISNAEALVSIEGLKQLAVKGKLKEVTEWIEDFLEVDGKLVVFATHKFVIDALMNQFAKVAVKIDGSVSQIERQNAVDSFQNNERIRLFVGNIQAAGVGITLTASSSVAFIELGWSSSIHEQAEDRCHRIGQKDSVNIYYLLAKGTIEEKIMKLISNKAKILNQVLDGVNPSNSGLFQDLLEEFIK